LLEAFVAATYVDNVAVSNSYSRLDVHEHSHGETFFTVLEQKFQCNRLFLLDEPEAALSPQRELAFLVLLHDTLHKHKDAQFIISGHSPLLLGYPEAQILSFDGGKIHEIEYEDLQCVQIARRFLNHRQNFLQQLLNDPPRLFPNEE